MAAIRHKVQRTPKIAVDIVLLPSDAMVDAAIKANKKLLQVLDDRIRLNKKNCLPHISLAMGVINRIDLQSVSGILKKVAQRFATLKLCANSISCGVTQNGKKVSGFEIKRTKDLQLLHEAIIQELTSHFSYDATTKMINGFPDLDGAGLDYINNYLKKASFKNFNPHITLGLGEAKTTGLPIYFTASQLALCHLGDYCTCSEVLAVAKLQT